VLLEWNESNNADGYQIKYYVYNKKKAVDTITTTSEKAMLDNVSTGKFYRAKVRGYSFINGKKKYGEWSKEIYFAYSVKDTYIRKVSGKYIYADWGNIKGATSYTIYVSKNITSGYKKVGKTKKSYFTIKKYAKKPLVPGTNYYVAIVANKKVGSKTYKTKRPTGIYLPHGF